MAIPFVTRCRSPVLSIRTQPEDEDNLRAEIEAATRTQHELLPRYSWHATIAKRDRNTTTKPPFSSLQRDLPPSQLARSYTFEDDQDFDDEAFEESTVNTEESRFPKHQPETKTLWRHLTGRASYSPSLERGPRRPKLLKNQETGRKQRKLLSLALRQSENESADQAASAPRIKSDFDHEETQEEQNTLSDLVQPAQSKTKRALRKSVYGSLSSTKSFLRSTSKSQFEKFRHGSTGEKDEWPHLDSFDTKDQLRDYLNSDSIQSPLSPIAQSTRHLENFKIVEPAELSAGPLPVELEGNGPDTGGQPEQVISRLSSPGIPDLPPYVEDKRFPTDLAKDNDTQTHQYEGSTLQSSDGATARPYTCSSCRQNITGHDVYDFCSICDTGDRVLCTGCAGRGPCCAHELEGLFRARASDRINPTSGQNQHGGTDNHDGVPVVLSDSSAAPRNSLFSRLSDAKPTNRTLNNMANDTSSHGSERLSDKSTQGRLEADLKSIQYDFLREMGSLRREQELLHRERELSLRAQEVDLRVQQNNLREREMLVQQKSDSFMRNLETLVSYQELAKSAFAGGQYLSRQNFDGSNKLPDGFVPTASDPCDTIGEGGNPNLACHNAAQDVAQPAASNLSKLDWDARVKSYAAQKRKKENQSSSTGSTPSATASSPEQARKPLSRGNSGRDGSQDEEEDENGHRTPKKHKQEPSGSGAPQLLFACPYSKNSPTRFSSRNTSEKNYRGCATHYLPDVSRLKQHLKRVHWQPETFCPRCYEEFEDSAKLADHARAIVVCPARECPFPEKMDKTQQEKIHVKRPRVPPETVWYDIYKVLFPGSPLPESPYMEGDERVITPLSATPQSNVHFQATQMLSNIFNNKINQVEDLRDSALRPLLQQALSESFTELLGAFSISPSLPPSAGPSIVVSPVSRSSSDTTRAFDSPPATASQRPKYERKRSVTKVVSQPQEVPRLQQPRPPRPKLHTALQVPHDHHRSPTGSLRQLSPVDDSPADVIFDINILPHIQEDMGYDFESGSFEHGDDQQAMGFVGESAPPPFRNKSVMSIDSGYGSGRSQQHPNSQAYGLSIKPPQISTTDHSSLPRVDTPENQMDRNYVPYHYPEMSFGLFGQPSINHDDYSIQNFQSYSNFLDPISQSDIPNGLNYPLPDSNNPWAYP